MVLIIKPTLKCNFKCTFCSSTTITEDDKQILDLDKIRQFVTRYPNTNTIIVNGGDPLMMSPQYYWDLITILDELDSPATISFTSNLWPFYKSPGRWVDLFNHPRMGIATSFQYGGARLKGDHTEFTEDDFWLVSDKMLELVGYRPTFLSVLDETNEGRHIDTVLLARKMGVVCKINWKNASGGEVSTGKVTMGSVNSMYTKADACKVYVDIWRSGLMEYEHNTIELAKTLRGERTICPVAPDCDKGIRVLQPDGDYYSCGAFGDDKEYPIDFDYEMSGGSVRALESLQNVTIKDSCYDCPMYKVCNSCAKTVADTRRLGLQEHHCLTMKSLAVDIIEMNGMTGYLHPTPYVDESPTIIAKG